MDRSVALDRELLKSKLLFPLLSSLDLLLEGTNISSVIILA